MSDVTVLIEETPPAVRPTVKAARRMVRAVAPEAEEIAYQMEQPKSKSMMWKLARYAVAGGETVVGIGTFSNHSTIFFYRGRELDDGKGVLQGGGKDARFITLRSPADAERPEVKRLVRKAFKLGSEAPTRPA
jgi:hypothetical protein